tara:strand:+ start:113 stop:418 length:306 start_codon:yes stop_codon:yes gene_type:complete
MEQLNKDIIQFNSISRKIEEYSKDKEIKPILDKIDKKDTLSTEEHIIYIQFTQLVNNNRLLESQLKDACSLAMDIKRGSLDILNTILPDVSKVYDLETKCL